MSIEKQLEDMSINPKSKCPIANLEISPDFNIEAKCPFHQNVHKDTTEEKIKSSKKYFPTDELIKEIGGGDRIRQMTTRFYAHVMEDQTISKFLFEDDCAASHGQRLGDWFIEHMGGEGTPWSDSGRHGLRQPMHNRAWMSKRRSEEDKGTRFKLDDCRIWMRLMFWSAREIGLHKHEGFMDRYVSFIQHMIGIYERSAPQYTRRDAKWSKNSRNIEEYKKNGYLMKDVIGVGR